ncbi:MAG: histidine kinase [Desulfobacterales bacterium]|nr:histidine kinase [Desulfobacterales bacterium]MCP4162364.1 histidine kinase [Deltaproteobacteria bacterium]
MKLTDIMSVEEWIKIEKEIHEKSGLNPTIYDTEGVSITQTSTWVNKLCPEIKGVPKGQTFICSAAHQNIASMAEQTKEPVIEECDAGLLKIVVPIYVDDTFIGAAGGCGLMLDDSEVEEYLVNMTAGIDESIIEEKAKTVKTISQEEAEEVAVFIMKRITEIVDIHKK